MRDLPKVTPLGIPWRTRPWPLPLILPPGSVSLFPQFRLSPTAVSRRADELQHWAAVILFVTFLDYNKRVWECAGCHCYNPENGGFIGTAMWLGNGAWRHTCKWLYLRSRRNQLSTSKSGGCMEEVKACPELYPRHPHSTAWYVLHLWPFKCFLHLGDLSWLDSFFICFLQ